MSVRPLGDGIYEVRWLESGVHRSRRVRGQREAKRLDKSVRDVKAARRVSGLGAASKLTLGAYLDDYWNGAHGRRLAPGTRRQRRGVLAAHVEPYLHDVRLCDLSKPRLEKWLGDVLAAGASERVATVALRDLSAVLGKVVEDELLPVNPALRVKGFRSGSLRKPPALGPAAIERLRVKLPSWRDVVLVELVGYAGLRPGEATALRWEDVREDGLLVDEAWAEGELKEPKGWRKRMVVDPVAPLLEDVERLRRKLGQVDEGAFVCPNRYGKPLDVRNWGRRVFKPACEAAGLGGGISFRSLRHSAASMWVAEGKPLTYVQSQLGHQSLKLTADTYTHAAVQGWKKGDSMDYAIRAARQRRERSAKPVAVSAGGLGLF